MTALTDITVDGVTIAAGEVAREAQYHPAPNPQDAWQDAAQALVVRQLLLQRARRLGLQPPPPKAAAPDDGGGPQETEEEGLIRQLLEQEVSTPEPDRESCRRYFENNRHRFRTADMVEARHILFLAAPDDTPARVEAETAARAAIDTLRTDPDRFAELARTQSACPSAQDGGALGQLTRGQTVPEFDTFLFNLEEGQLCPTPVKTRFGVHVVKVERRVAGHELPFEAVADRIADYLQQTSWARGVAQYIRLLAGAARIEGIEIGGTDSPLVQ